MASSRPQVQVFNKDGKAVKGQVPLPGVLVAPIRTDVVRFVHTNIAKNARQPYAVNELSGEQTPAESWGAGRAVARIPRVPGGGTNRSGQGAFGNMCRKGRMFAPTKVWRKWHRKVNQNQRRYAVCSALAASAIPALVLARGHSIMKVPEVPLVIANEAVQGLTKTKDAVALLEKLGAYADVEKVKNSRQVRTGVGKMRNRRYVQRRGPLIVYNKKTDMTKAFRNIPGVELCSVDALNLLQLAPGGHLGRFIIWTKDSFEKLDSIYGSQSHKATQKSDYRPPRHIMLNSDLSRIINSDEVQSVLKPAGPRQTPASSRKRNPLVNVGAMMKLNPAAASQKRKALLAQDKSNKGTKTVIAALKKKKKASSKKSNPVFKKLVLSA